MEAIIGTWKTWLAAWMSSRNLITQIPGESDSINFLAPENLAEFLSVGPQFSVVGSEQLESAINSIVGDML